MTEQARLDREFLIYLRNRPGGRVDPDRTGDEVLAKLRADWLTEQEAADREVQLARVDELIAREAADD